jgi:hypothetical protein
MRESGSRILPLAILIMSGIIGIVVALSYVLGTDEGSEDPISTFTSNDFPISEDLDELARRSDYVIRGAVIKEDSTTRQVPSGERGPTFNPVIISTVKVNEVIQGTLQEPQITVGQTGIETDPAPPKGSQVVLFLRKVDHSAARYAIPYDYFSSGGPQGVFLIDVDSNKTTPLGPSIAPTTERYQGAPVAQFLEETRQAALRNPEPRPGD